MNGKFLHLALGCLCSFNACAITQAPLLYCNGCASTAKQSAALALHIPGIVYVGDASTDTVQAFSVWSDIDDSQTPPKRAWYTDSTTPTEPYLSTATHLIDFYNAMPKGWTKKLR